MSLGLARSGEQIGLEAFVAKTAPQPLTLRLYINDRAPSDFDATANFVQATFTGYAAKPLVGADWSTTAGDPEVLASTPQSWTLAGASPQTIYGYYLTQTTSNLLIGSQRFTRTITLRIAGDSIRVTPKLALGKRLLSTYSYAPTGLSLVAGGAAMTQTGLLYAAAGVKWTDVTGETEWRLKWGTSPGNHSTGTHVFATGTLTAALSAFLPGPGQYYAVICGANTDGEGTYSNELALKVI